ncbi:TIGR04372 family glycosyltransferase [Helicobacter cinaedi]|uniref:TIGR04372 family glycosyltransferase n=1 Tax=Helicobacter cinaedi TaxID=213 RepID=UPI000DA1DF8E|nr:TIGR04372 family glycosyltransferase [Helicobacter cinaedi]
MFKKCKDLVKAILPTSVYGVLREGIFRCVGYIKFAVKLILFPFVWPYMWVLNLKQPTRVTTLISCRIGHLALNTDLFVRQRKSDTNERIIFLAPLPVSNEFLLQRWSEIIEVVSLSKHPFYVRCLSLLLFFKSKYAFELPYEGNEYDIYLNTKSSFYFTDSEKQDGDRILEEMGIGKNDWFVCVFARDSAYLDQTFEYSVNHDTGERGWSYHDYRDSDIDSLNLAIDEILARGGFVVRLGKVVAKAMSYKHDKVIDYPLSKWRSDFMDIYLQYRAKFVLSSSTSGATDVCSLFDTPYCGVNTPAYWNIPYKNAIQIPKIYRHKHNGKMVGLQEWIKLVETQKADRHYGCDYEDPTQLSIWHSGFYAKNELEIINNTPEEILELTKEMFERLDGSFTQSDEDKKRQEKYLAINATYLPVKECKNPYGRDFLAKNPWFLENYK